MRERREFSRVIKAQIVHRAAMPDGRIKCEGCGLVLGKKVYHIDHTLPEGLRADKTKPLTAADGKLLGWDCCHKPKTAADVRQIRKSDRQRDKIGFGIRSTRNLIPGSRGTRFKRRLDGTTVLREAT